MDLRQLPVAQGLSLRCDSSARVLVDGEIKSMAVVGLCRTERCYDERHGEGTRSCK